MAALTINPELRSLRIRLAVPLVALLTVGTTGTCGYHFLWREYGGTWIDAVYMVVITMTTVGFREVHPLDDTGRLLTMGVAIVGIGSLFYLLGVVMDYVVNAQIRDRRGKRKMQKRIDALRGHFIVAGLGRMGRQAAEELDDSDVGFVILDPSDAAAQFCADRDLLLVRGDATEDELFLLAGVKQARDSS